MAKINDNLFVLGASGMVGKQMIFRNRKGTIILSKRPRHIKQHTDAQLEHMLRFKEATPCPVGFAISVGRKIILMKV